ncbi:hypothetical protein [Pseudoalteromonas sp. T1lg48]|uniref:hypothetical protein n=1 Tax=Pseudoalteromonas sp. T1lg48 TaxID=2077100 RepID=UPI000CF6F085|nr:hypothetical protein [Pseudoalteromonas sp. T1lg48]
MSFTVFRFCHHTSLVLLLGASALIASLFSGQAWAQSPKSISTQTQVLVGGGLQVCSSMTPEHCLQPIVGGKTQVLYRLDHQALIRLDRQWPAQYQAHKAAVVKTLTSMVSDQALTQEQLLALWYQHDPQAQLLARPLYYYVLDTLESAEPSLTERIDVDLTKDEATGDLIAFMHSAISVAAGQQAQAPRVLMLSSASRDPYARADYYDQLLTTDGIDGQWLPLTPALAKALSQGRCEMLEEFRRQALTFDRARVYPKQIAQEQALCAQGTEALLAQINAASAVFFNDGDQTLARKALFDEQGKAYPWTEALRSRPVILANGAGTALQSGGRDGKANVTMITGGDAFAALEDEVAVVTQPGQLPSGFAAISHEPRGGLGSFHFGVLDTYFSELNRSVRLSSLLYGTGQPAGYGIDADTALVVIKSEQGSVATVLGKAGVVKIQPTDKHSFRYSYYPNGVRMTLDEQQWRLAASTQAIEVRGPSAQALPQMRFGDILYDSKLRSLTQAMCLSSSAKALAAQYTRGNYRDFTLRRDEHTHMLNTGIRDNACAIEGLIIEFAPRK